jgi:hypothetical protein
MKIALLTGLFAATTTLAGLLLNAAPAAAFSWNASWSQPQILGKSQTGFDDAPFQPFVQAERIAIPNAGQFVLDPSKLKLRYDHNVSVYFINEGAGYRNQLAFEATGTTQKSGLIFNDISCEGPGCVGGWGGNALKLGDGVNLGTMAKGTQLDFWLRADGLNRGNSANIFGTKTASNEDGLQHAVAYAYKNYILMGFEDLYGAQGAYGRDAKTGRWNEGSDRDFNDAVFVVDVGEKNVQHMTGSASVPEPSMMFGLLGLGASSLFRLKRRQQA